MNRGRWPIARHSALRLRATAWDAGVHVAPTAGALKSRGARAARSVFVVGDHSRPGSIVAPRFHHPPERARGIVKNLITREKTTARRKPAQERKSPGAEAEGASRGEVLPGINGNDGNETECRTIIVQRPRISSVFSPVPRLSPSHRSSNDTSARP